MGVTVFPSSSGGGIKSVQRGTAATAGTITITAVDTSKTYVTSFGTAAAGSSPVTGSASSAFAMQANWNNLSSTGGQGASGTYTPGTTTLSTKVYGVSLTNSTTLTATGACRYEVVEML